MLNVLLMSIMLAALVSVLLLPLLVLSAVLLCALCGWMFKRHTADSNGGQA